MAHIKQLSRIGNRIKLIRGKISQSEFASELKTIKQTISKYEKGKILPCSTALYRLHKKFHINLNWLLTGEGGKYKYPESMMKKFRIWCNNNLWYVPSDEDQYIYGMFVEQLGMERTKSIVLEMTSKISTIEKTK